MVSHNNPLTIPNSKRESRKQCCLTKWSNMGRSSLFGCIGTAFGTKRWLTLDKCGLVCISISFSSLIYAYFEVYHGFIANDVVATILFSVFYTPFTILALASLFMAWTSDPGSVPMGARPLPPEIDLETGTRKDPRLVPKVKRGIRRCRKCNDNFKPPRAHHDSVTGRCIVKMDHFWYVDVDVDDDVGYM